MKVFQFPSNGKVDPKGNAVVPHWFSNVFQFPSNGKVYPKLKKILNTLSEMESFNSLQTGKCIQRTSISQFLVRRRRFQFPSNGKVDPKSEYGYGIRWSHGVSIPFKRESVFKARYYEFNRLNAEKVSIPFKRESVSKVDGVLVLEQICLNFNSLQTGKCIQRIRRKVEMSTATSGVSIPFKRESVFREQC